MNNLPLSPRSLSAFRELMTHSDVSSIEKAFANEGFKSDSSCPYQDGNEQRRLTQSFISNIDWDDVTSLSRLLRAMESTLHKLLSESEDISQDRDWRKFVKCMADDGYKINADGSIFLMVGAPITLASSMRTVERENDVLEGIKRLKSMRDNPAETVSAAKVLVESTAKFILQKFNVSGIDGFSFSQLIMETQHALGLHPTSGCMVDEDPSVHVILEGAISIVSGLADFVNAGHGSEHGGSTSHTGVVERHASLAINAAVLWCEMIVSTYSDPKAPWRTMS